MTITYKDDDSFFTTVFPPFVYYGFSIKSWFSGNKNAKFRYIKDTEMEREFWRVDQIQDLYPGIKTIGIVVNPWVRMRYAYLELCKMKAASNKVYTDLNILELDSFEDFIKSLIKMKPVDNFWFTLATPMCDWFEANGHKADFILKDTNLVNDFKEIQDYFCSDIILTIAKAPAYRKSYTKETRSIVAEVFKKDIEQFDYKF